MLYCPKCHQSYEDGAQRFCTNDGARLLPEPNSPKMSAGANGVFKNFLGKRASEEQIEEKFAAMPRFAALEPLAVPDSSPNIEKPFPFNDDEIELELEPKENPAFKPPVRNIKPGEVPSGTAEVGDRKINPVNRAALSRKNPRVLIGQTVKGRYEIVGLLGEDETSLAYLAEDRLAQRKKVLVRVLTDGEILSGNIYAEEIVSLSHVNHPNIARVIDSGELIEGNPFIVSEYTEGDSIRDLMKKAGQLNVQRAARIVRQVAGALGEAHQNGILHRNLKPENVLLAVNESGAEQVKLISFGTAGGTFHAGNIAYKAPEILDGKPSTRASDIYSLGVIAYQTLTNRLPFSGENARDLLKAQRDGLAMQATDLRPDLSSSVDAVLEKALSFDSAARYPKARDFGDAFYNALLNSPPVEAGQTAQSAVSSVPFNEKAAADPSTPIIAAELEDSENFHDDDETKVETLQIKDDRAESEKIEAREGGAAEEFAFDSGAFVAPQAAVGENGAANSKSDLWTRRSPEPPKNNGYSLTVLSLLGLLILLAAVLGVWFYSVNRRTETEFAAVPAPNVAHEPQNSAAPAPSPASPLADIETAPLPRRIEQPPGTIYFQNSKQNLKGDLLSNFIGFSLYFPESWKVNQVAESGKAGGRGKFLDISKTEDDKLSEQMLVSYYDSRGTFKEDAARFPQLAKETNETLKSLIPNYQTLSEGETTINGGWRAYEVKFQGGGIANGEKLIVWGRRLFIPVSRSGARSGYEITMLATSLASEVQSVDDVGTKGDLAAILQTFEPNGNF